MPHPLDPLTADEIRRAAAIVRHDREVGDGWRFASIELKEPAKADLPALENGRLAADGRRAGREALQDVVTGNRADQSITVHHGDGATVLAGHDRHCGFYGVADLHGRGRDLGNLYYLHGTTSGSSVNVPEPLR